MKILIQKNPLLKIAALLFLASCATIFSPEKYGKVTIFNSVEKKSFVFVVNEEFAVKNKKSKKDEAYPIMSESEAGLLRALLRKNNYCIVNGDLLFKVNSKQEKIYDATFAHLIEQSYNARPAVPTTYFGECF